MMDVIRLLAISGSIRRQSTNTEVLRALALLAPLWVTVRHYDGLATLPAFNPDLDGENMTPPAAVQDLRSQIANADAVVICSPEYAHGVPGSLKNALDWLVSVPDMVNKPTALVNASPRSIHAQLSLAETLSTMSMHLVADAPYVVPLVERGMTAEAIASDPALGTPLHNCLDALITAVSGNRQAAAVSLPAADDTRLRLNHT